MARLVEEIRPTLRVGTTEYTAQVWGARRDDGSMWDGWLVFVANDGSPRIRTEPETVQKTLDALAYWGTGLTPVYLDGALARAIDRTRTSAV